MPDRTAQLHDIADHLGHRLVVLGRDFLIDLDGGVQRAGERRVLHHRDRMLGCDLADFQGKRVGAMGDGSVRMAAAAAVGAALPVLYIELRKDGAAIDPGPWWSKSGIEKARG